MPLRYNPLHDEKVIGERDDVEIERYLKEVADDSTEFKQAPWKHTAHVFGYLPTGSPSAGPAKPLDAGNIEPDKALIGQQVTIKLDRLRVYDYPGGGTHRVLVEFGAEHQPTSPGAAVEPLRFTQVFRAEEGSGAGISGYPVFRDLGVGKDGLFFRIFTVNVSNDDDEAAFAFLESSAVTGGLKLLTTANPAIAPFVDLAQSVTRLILGHHRNVPVQDAYLGLDFSDVKTGAKLRRGAYLVVQVPDAAAWDWSKVKFDITNGQFVDATSGEALPYNYLVFSVS